jgi:hypothetical protein
MVFLSLLAIQTEFPDSARPKRERRGALHRIGVNRKAPAIKSVGTRAITLLPIKSSRISLLAII